MNVLYEEEGALKTGAVLADQNTSLQVEAPHGKRSKIKAAAVLLRFDDAPLHSFLSEAQKLADEIDIDFLWQCCGEGEIAFEELAREYYGARPRSAQAAAVALKLHGAPMYFYKKGKGRYKAAPEEALKAALASVERKQRQAAQRQAYVEALVEGQLPEAFMPVLPMLLYRPDKAALEWKALEEASAALKATPIGVLERAGAIPSTHDYHYQRFVFENFPRGTDFAPELPVPDPGELPVAQVEAFSIDDASTTEIDDAFSVTRLPNGNVRIGIHIAAPALAVTPGSPVDAIARERLSTVYFPGGKITMLPPSAIARYTLAERCECPALSLYTELTPDFEVIGSETRAERVPVIGNLRHDALEPVLTVAALEAAGVAHEQADELHTLWLWSTRLEQARRGDQPEPTARAEYSFHVENDRITIARRARGSPLDRIVSELMIYVNSTWGGMLAGHDMAAIYRVQGAGKVRMSTVPAAHEGLGVAQYAWASSPLRRYVDLVNQRQLLALVQGQDAPYAPGSEQLLGALRDFEAAYETYAEFQRTMERYWSLRWLIQEGRETVTGAVIRENLVRLDEVPLVVRVPSVPTLPQGARVSLAVGHIDLLDLTVHCEYQQR
ncbi:MAG TPA: RNB domain-containing ribonuclease, partial [Burkholderiales bacterium]|nr:RNB domain-containing ribonuclease [Burkholderiales bacterium]